MYPMHNHITCSIIVLYISYQSHTHHVRNPCSHHVHIHCSHSPFTPCSHSLFTPCLHSLFTFTVHTMFTFAVHIHCSHSLFTPRSHSLFFQALWALTLNYVCPMHSSRNEFHTCIHSATHTPTTQFCTPAPPGHGL